MNSDQLNPILWRHYVARWPVAARQKWGEYANFFESQGMSWKEAEHKAYQKVEEILAAHARKNPGWRMPLCVVEDRSSAYFEPEPGTKVAAVAVGKKWRRLMDRDEVFAEFIPSDEAVRFIKIWNERASARWDQQQEAVRIKAEAEKAKEQARLDRKANYDAGYRAEREPAKKKSRGRRRKPAKNSMVISWS